MPTNSIGGLAKSKLTRIKRRASGGMSQVQERLTDETKQVKRRLSEADRGDVQRALRRAEQRIDVDEEVTREQDPTAQRAADAARMGPPVDATLDPLTTPEHADALAGGRGNMTTSMERYGQVPAGVAVRDSLVTPDSDDDVEPLATGGSITTVDAMVVGPVESDYAAEDDMEMVGTGGDDSDPLAVDAGFEFGFGGEE